MADIITSGTGVKVQEAAAPVTDTDINVTGADIDGDEAFDDADEQSDDEYVEGGEGELDTESATSPVNTQTAKTAPDQNAVYADIRRKAETEARIKATQEAQRSAAVEIDTAFADMGLTDPYTNKLITTKAEYTAYKSRHNSELIGTELNKAGISREAMDALIDSHPAVQQAKQAATAYEAAQRQAQDGAAKVQLDEQLKEISALDPAIKSVDDLAAQPYYEQIRGYVRKGLTIVEAYKLSNMDNLTNKTASAAAQSAYNKTASKEHLTSSAARGQGETPISKAQLNTYRMLNPSMTDKQIREDYAKFKKNYS